jgi:hypothetical protein
MTKIKFGLVAAVAALMLLAAPVSAITYGEPDAGEHPYVGFMIFYDPAAEGWYSCSGTLLDADTFLTAGHCTYGIGTDGELLGTSGGTDVWVTFEETGTLQGWPLRSEIGSVYADVDALDAARRAWLNDPANGFVTGTAYPHPMYDEFSGFPVNYDVGVVELNATITLSTYGVLAPLGTAEALAGQTGAGRNDALVESVGYGTQAIQPHPQSDDDRYKSTSRIVQVNGSISRGGNLHTLNNPSPIGGTGGTCFGDSGGPVFVNDTNQVIAVVSFGFSGTCHGADYSWRVDTQDSRDFVLPFLGI